jgi:DNA-binding IclR family transcriptional regulator
VTDDGNLDDESAEAEAQSGVKAVETAARLLVAMRESNGSEMLKDIAARAKMHPAKAHRYLVSLIRVGLIKKDEESGRYQWGPLAIDIGASAIRNTSLVRAAVRDVRILRDKLGVTVALAVWGTFGPTHILIEEANRPVITKSQIGSVLPLTTSATGRAFAAFSQAPEVEEAVADEIRMKAKTTGNKSQLRQEFDALCAKIRADGVATSLGDFYAGIIALSCPVFDHRNMMIGAITILSHQGDFDPSLDGTAARELSACCQRLSRDLGYLPG